MSTIIANTRNLDSLDDNQYIRKPFFPLLNKQSRVLGAYVDVWGKKKMTEGRKMVLFVEMSANDVKTITVMYGTVI